jgi:hypothetical protein
VKRDLVKYKQDHPSATLAEVGDAIQRQHNLDRALPKQTISDVLKESSRWAAGEPRSAVLRQTKGRYPQLEEATLMWINDAVGYAVY